jgi:GT2 family glycosyltransferase/glycosyltransferase involved in cell wall biosynthesis
VTEPHGQPPQEPQQEPQPEPPEPGQRPVAVVILTWNALAFTQRCLAALQERTDHSAWRLIVVDNGSTDGTVEWLREQDWLTLIENATNLGFTKGCNIGIAACAPDEDVVLMNNDVDVVDRAWLTKLQDTAYADETTGVVGSRLVHQDGTVLHLGAYMQPVTIMGQQVGGFEIDVNQCTRDRAVETVVFAQAYLRRNCLDQVGPLDEDLFAYFEDSDYCLRAIRAGFGVVVAGSVTSVHHQSASTRANNVDFWTVYEKSRRTFTRKWARWLEHDRYEGQAVWHSVMHQPMGYAIQSRHLMTALHFKNIRLAFRNAYGDVDGPTGDLLIDDIAKRQVPSGAPQVAFCQADAFGRVTGAAARVGWSMLEVTGLPQTWVDGCNSMDEVWVPSTFNVETFRTSGVRVPIRVMPLGVDTDYFHPGITGYRPSTRFTFLSVFEWGERKAPEVLLRAFTEEFKDSEDVLLLLSVANRDPQVDIQQQIDALGLGTSAPIVVMPNARFTGPQMGSLYRSADCFVLPSRGEGWGMPVLEAMACGLPTIATRWSGPADFLHEGVGYPLEPARLVRAEARCPYYAGFEWADPDVDQLRSLMRTVFEDQVAAQAKGLAAAAEVAARWTWDHAAEKVRRRLLELQ